MTVRFDEAWISARRVAARISDDGLDVVLVRNLLGMISVVLGNSRMLPATDLVQRVGDELRAETGPFCALTPVLIWQDLSAPEALADAPGRSIVREPGEGVGRLITVERTVVGTEWSRITTDPPGRRVTLYGFKGGVGRSTATVMLARHLAKQGQCVLVVDLDLESPGVSALLIDDEQLPASGIVDHFAEAAVDNAAGLDLVARSSAIRSQGNGEVWIAPASGRPGPTYRYLPKLNRAYLEEPPFAERLNDAVTACEDRVTFLSRAPDVVLLDSRAGLHDIAAVAITQLSDLSLLFAVDNPHTWAGYRELFREWGTDPERARAIRERLKMVASGVPTARDDYLLSFLDHSQTCLAELYDDVDMLEGYNPSLQDVDAPHWPLPISFQPNLVGLDAAAHREWLEDAQIESSFFEFLQGATDLIERSFS